jgi:hypothetical protein
VIPIEYSQGGVIFAFIYLLVVVGAVTIAVTAVPFALTGGFTQMSFAQSLLVGVTAAASGTAGDVVATTVLQQERPRVIQEVLEDRGVVPTCSWEDTIKGTWSLDYLGGNDSVYADNDSAYIKFKSSHKFELKLYTTEVDSGDYNNELLKGKYYCGPGNRLRLVSEIEKKQLKEELGSMPLGKLDLKFTIVYDVDLQGDTLTLDLYDAYFGGEAMGRLIKRFEKRGVPLNDPPEGYGCDLTDVECWNNVVFYLLNQNMPYAIFTRT